jgi:UPF0176 protein
MSKNKKITPGSLRNKVNREILREQIQNDPTPRTTISFYRYINLTNIGELRDKIWIEWDALGVLGRIYLAAEGVNAQLSVPTANFEAFRTHVDSYDFMKDVPFKIAVEDDGKSFIKLDIKIRKKIVADGLNDENFDTTDVGKHLTAQEFNALLENPETVCIDMRNNYESRIGHFDGAICPNVETFRDELPKSLEILAKKNPTKDKPVILYCTGGIRCEKASAFLKHNGYRDVGQLHGGIIDYKHQVEREGLDNKFKGKNFVFDERDAESISHEVISDCDQCGEKCDSYTNCGNMMCNVLFIQCHNCAQKLNGCCCDSCKDFSLLPEAKQKILRQGKKGDQRYKKPEECGCS